MEQLKVAGECLGMGGDGEAQSWCREGGRGGCSACGRDGGCRMLVEKVAEVACFGGSSSSQQ